MKIAYYIMKRSLRGDARVLDIISRLGSGGNESYDLLAAGVPEPGTDMIVSLGGDGTFLSAAAVASVNGIPVVGVNMGRLGFLAAYSPDEIADAILSGQYEIEERSLLQVSSDSPGFPHTLPYALNELTVNRAGSSMLGVNICVDGYALPTCWADGILVSTSSGSTAYNLSAGGPICTPDSKVLIITPISPHNLNVRPMVVPESAVIGISFRSRDGQVAMSIDNSNYKLSADSALKVNSAPVRLRIVHPGTSGFLNALRTRLLWGADVRNPIDR